MANGYLGKISAVVSANTADFSSKLNAAAKDVQKFASSMQGSLTSAQSSSSSALRGIYTDAQKLERALTAISTRKLQFSGFQGPDLQSAVTRMQALYSATEQINKPLADAAKSFGRLSLSVQGEFNPALVSAQTAVEKLADTINRSGTASADQFSRVARQVEITTAAMSRMKEAGAAVSGLATGQELRFQRPEMAAEMQRSSRLQSDASQMSPAAISSGGIAGLVQQQAAAARETERLAAALENESQLVNGNVAGATAAYETQLAVQRRVNDEIERRVKVESDAKTRAAAAAADEIALLQRREQAAKQAEVERQAQAQRVADSEIANLQRVQQAAKQAEVERQAQAQRVADSEIANLQRVQQAAKQAEVERQAQAQRVADSELAMLQRREQAAKTAEQERLARAQQAADGESASLIRREQAAKAAATGGESSLGLGLDIEASARQLGVLQGGITSLKSQIDTLPEPLRARFVPAIREAEAEFIRLSSAAVPVAEQIEAARQRLIHLTQDATRAAQAMNFSQSFGGAGMTGVNLGLDQRSLQGYNAQLQILQGYMSRIPAEAAGPAVAAFNQLRNAIAQAFDDGTINTAETRRELAALLQATTQTTAALAGVSAGRIGRDIQRAGDIGRRGFDNMSLALNQAAFAIDDFMSSTGGLEFKLRAVSNNITQLAFILGGTTGLFIGLGAVIAGQAAVGLIKWINNGRTAEDQTKALNEALARQKSLVEELAEAFRSLGTSATRGIFSEQAQQARDFAREIENILKKQRELGLQRVVGNDPTIQRERAEQAKLRREVEKEENPAVRVGKQQQLRASEDREQRRTQLLGVQPPPSAAEIRREVRLRAPVPFRNAAEGIPEGTDVASRVAQADAIRPAVDRLKEIVSEGNSSFDFGRFEIASRQLESLGDLLDRLDRAIGDAVAQAATDVAKASRGPAEQIRQAQEEVARAIEVGLPGARLFGEELNKSAEQLDKAYKKLENAAAGKDEKGRDIGPAEQKALVDAASSEIDALNARRRDIAAQADALAYERIVDPQRQIDARMGRARSNLGAAGLEDGRIARRMREIENERETIRQRSALPEFQTPEMVRGLQDAEQALNEEAAAIEAATIAIKAFSDALNRASEEAKGNLNSAQQAADEARRADLGGSTPQTQEARRQAEADLERQREIERNAQTEIAVERDRLEQMQRPDAARLSQIDEQLKSGIDNGDREALIRERETIRGRMEDEARVSQDNVRAIRDASTREEEQRKKGVRGGDLTRTPEGRFRAETEQGLADIQAYFERRAEANNGIRPAGDIEAQAAAEDRFRKDREREARTATAAGRGRELGMTPEERFRRDMKEGPVADLTAAAKEMRAKGENPAALLRQGVRNQMEQVAPMLKQFAEERQNAILQGPSRAALNVSDVSTTQGASELTRLLRGDDSAKDVNLAELQKQTQKFEELIKAVKDANPGVLL